MRDITFFRVILLLPLAPLIPLAFGGKVAGHDDSWFEFLQLASLIGGAPYALLVVSIWIWSRGRNVVVLRNVILASPFLQAGIQILVPVYFVLEQGVFQVLEQDVFQVKEFFFSWFVLMPFAIGVGYFYIALMFLIYALLRWAGAVKASAKEPIEVE